MTLKHKRIEVWNQLITPLDRISNEWGNLRIHPWFDDAADGVIILVRFETVDSKAR